MGADLNRTNYQILKVKYYISQLEGIQNIIKDPKNYNLTIRTTNMSISYVDIVELIFVYLIIFNTIILIVRKYKKFKI